jgi:hypothetical protein
MRQSTAGLVLFVPAVALAAPPMPDGRWQGAIHIPGRELSLVVDLARDPVGNWRGSLIIPGAGVKGAPLANIVVTESALSFDAGNALRAPGDRPATFKARMTGAGGMAGEFTQGGNVAAFSLKRAGAEQVESPVHSTAVRADLEAEWTGEFELGGYPRHVTIAFENHAATAATATFVIVGKRRNELPVDLVSDEGDYVRVESQATRVSFEGRYLKDAREIRGTIELGALELPVVLRRAAGKSP